MYFQELFLFRTWNALRLSHKNLLTCSIRGSAVRYQFFYFHEPGVTHLLVGVKTSSTIATLPASFSQALYYLLINEIIFQTSFGQHVFHSKIMIIIMWKSLILVLS